MKLINELHVNGCMIEMGKSIWLGLGGDKVGPFACMLASCSTVQFSSLGLCIIISPFDQYNSKHNYLSFICYKLNI